MWWDCGRWFLMQNYEKPEVILMTECSEDVYLASGGQTGEDPTAGGCDSRYMKGAWKKPDYSNSNVQMRAYDRKGCEGCAADDGDGCKLQKGDAKVAGNVYQPVWEQQGLTPDTMVW